MHLKDYPKGAIIIEEGIKSDNIYFITTGRVRIFKIINNEEINLATLGPGDFFGEMSMFLGSKRTATVQALDYTEIKVGDKKNFISSIRKDPNMAIKVIATMAKRIKKAHDIISRLEGERKSYEILLSPFDR